MEMQKNKNADLFRFSFAPFLPDFAFLNIFCSQQQIMGGFYSFFQIFLPSFIRIRAQVSVFVLPAFKRDSSVRY
jgi:hypothetical protein